MHPEESRIMDMVLDCELFFFKIKNVGGASVHFMNVLETRSDESASSLVFKMDIQFFTLFIK